VLNVIGDWKFLDQKATIYDMRFRQNHYQAHNAITVSKNSLYGIHWNSIYRLDLISGQKLLVQV
jgi:hypothetical protein